MVEMAPKIVEITLDTVAKTRVFLSASKSLSAFGPVKIALYASNENPLAKHAVTHYRVIERFAYCTLVECKLETGRTHQIRVHMKHIGHTLFNDDRYGGNEPLKGVPTAKYKQFVRNCFEACPRQALHAKTLGFTHPTTGEWMQFDSELPADIKALLEKWRKYNPSNIID